MIPFIKTSFIKYFLIALLAFKASYFVQNNLTSLFENSIENYDILADIEDTENEENEELTDNEKITTSIFLSLVFIRVNNSKTNFNRFSHYKDHFFEYSTPPPELG